MNEQEAEDRVGPATSAEAPAPATVGWADVVAAADRLGDAIPRTPTARSRTLSEIAGADVIVKFENLQFTGSFKDRGALNKLLSLDDDQRRRGVVAASAGNHAQGVAHHAAKLGIAATIVMPVTAPLTKVASTTRLGARVLQEGRTVTDAAELAERLVDEEGLTLVHPYDDPLIVAGQGTAGAELFEDTDRPLDVVLVPVGGGGLASGIAIAAAELSPATKVIGVQTELYPSMVDRLAGRPYQPRTDATSIADGIAVKRPGELTSHLLASHGVEMLTVSEARIEEAVGLLVEVEKTVTEGAGAIGLAALLGNGERFAGMRCGIVLSGGNIDPRLLASVILRSLVRQGRLTHLRVEADDLPGNLARVAGRIGELGGNLIEVSHDRLLNATPARRVDLDLLVETLDAGHLARIRAGLEADGHDVDVVDP
ncbi:MAG: threonine ammonia-lyase [Actinomycetota bacterium]|nr:threonine ammonia-lyase [Actinomycetota bacterium]